MIILNSTTDLIIYSSWWSSEVSFDLHHDNPLLKGGPTSLNRTLTHQKERERERLIVFVLPSIMLANHSSNLSSFSVLITFISPPIINAKPIHNKIIVAIKVSKSFLTPTSPIWSIFSFSSFLSKCFHTY